MSFIFIHFCHFIKEIKTMGKNKHLLKFRFKKSIYNRLLLNILYVINQKYGLNL